MRVAVAAVGAAFLVEAVGRSLGKAGSPSSRWREFLAAAPAGAAWMAIGVAGGALSVASRVLVCAGLAAALLLLFMVARRTAPPAAADLGEERGFWLEELPERLGALLMDYERWVIDATLGAAVALVRVAAWAVNLADEHVLTAPANGAAAQIGHGQDALLPIVGGSMKRAAWVVLAALALAAFALTLWLGR